MEDNVSCTLPAGVRVAEKPPPSSGLTARAQQREAATRASALFSLTFLAISEQPSLVQFCRITEAYAFSLNTSLSNLSSEESLINFHTCN